MLAVLPTNPTDPAAVKHCESLYSESMTTVEGTPFPWISSNRNVGWVEKTELAGTVPETIGDTHNSVVAAAADTFMFLEEQLLETVPILH